MKFTNFSLQKAFRLQDKPLTLIKQREIKQAGLYLYQDNLLDLLRDFLFHEDREVVYLPEHRGDNEILLGLLDLKSGENLSALRDKTLDLKEKISKLLCFSQPYLTPGELFGCLKDNPEIALVIVEGWRSFIPPGTNADPLELLRELKKISALSGTAIIFQREPDLEPFTGEFLGQF